jgi:dTDP-glucose pyrophosphorylase
LNEDITGRNMQDIAANLLTATASVKDALATIEQARAKIALVVDGERHLLGTVTDGDIRRAILHGVSIEAPVAAVMNVNPRFGRAGQDDAAIIDLMRRNICRHVPIVDEAGRVIALATLDELVEYGNRDNWVVLMAGGLGNRLQPLTKDVPKPMLSVGDRPILQTIVESFRGQGFSQFFISLNHLGDVIREHFGDGSRWGAHIEYITEDKPLGTAGALSLLPDKPSRPIIVMNGDILTKVNFRQLVEFHEDHRAQATMCVRDYHVEVPFGVIENDGHRIRGLKEKPTHRFLVNAGIYALDPDALELIPRNEFYDMPSLIDTLVTRGQHACLFQVREYWLDVGRPDDFDRARREFSGEFGD